MHGTDGAGCAGRGHVLTVVGRHGRYAGGMGEGTREGPRGGPREGPRAPNSSGTLRWMWIAVGVLFFAVGVVSSILQPDDLAFAVIFMALGVVFFSLSGTVAKRGGGAGGDAGEGAQDGDGGSAAEGSEGPKA